MTRRYGVRRVLRDMQKGLLGPGAVELSVVWIKNRGTFAWASEDGWSRSNVAAITSLSWAISISDPVAKKYWIANASLFRRSRNLHRKVYNAH